jgi:DNA-binding CsgD family transcriptional regulator
MYLLRFADDFARAVSTVDNSDVLADIVDAATREMGFRYFALAHHIDAPSMRAGINVHNYPDVWAEWFDDHRLGSSDPVRRASQRTSLGFTWSRVPELIALSPRDREVLERARHVGIGDGFTVPAHVPGESAGSCSFAVPRGKYLPERSLPIAQLIGAFAFEGARRVRKGAQSACSRRPLTDRQRDCVYWVARGKTDWEISRILGLSHDTVIQHLKQARQRLGVARRSQLAVQALFEGSLSFIDLLDE